MENPGLPTAFLERMQALLGEEFPAFLASYADLPTVGLRVNTLKVSPQAFADISPFPLQPIPWCPAGFELHAPGDIPDSLTGAEIQPGKHPYHAAGLYYLQEPSAMAVGELLDPQPGERVLDLAAAPGGKATHIASKLGDAGLLVANEIHPRRVWELAENLERWGTRQGVILNETPERIAAHFGPFFDRVLLDAPCSGEGMFRRSKTALQEWSPELVESCASRQGSILESAAKLVRPGGWLVYSTCTFAPEENEGAIARFLDMHSDFTLISAPRETGYAQGRPEWSSAPSHPDLARSIRLWPHHASAEGHFIAILRRDLDGETAQPRLRRPVSFPKDALRLWRDFQHEALSIELPEDELALIGSYLYALPNDLPDLGNLKAVHPGWWLGTIKKNRFEPSHALSLSLKPGQALRSVDLSSNSPQVFAYLHGEAFPLPGESGWTLVTVDGYALGWSKRVTDMLKNFYPKGLRS